jgi:RimJ/RimL family protein N-acetyltransferase
VSVELRRAEEGDVEFLLELVTDAETEPFLGGTVRTREDVRADVERSRREPEDFGWLVAEVDGERVGCASFRRTSERNRIAEVGRFAVHPRYRGRRLGDEVARAVQRHLLHDLGFHRIELQIYGFNERALAHAERVGYVREGVKRKAYEKFGAWQDAVLFSLLQEELDG